MAGAGAARDAAPVAPSGPATVRGLDAQVEFASAMSGTTALNRQFRDAAVRFALVCAALAMLLAAEPLLPNLVADPPTNISLETSTTEGGLKKETPPELLLRFNGYDGGLPGFVERAREFASRHGERFEPPASLVEKAERGERYEDQPALLAGV